VRKSRLHASPVQRQASSLAHQSTPPATRTRNDSILYLQQTIGNQAVQRYLDGLTPVGSAQPSLQRALASPAITVAAADPGALLQRSWGNEKLDSRVESQKVDEATEGCGVKKRKVEYNTQKKGPINPYGATASKLLIDYAVDDAGKVTLGCLRPEFIITIYSPYVTSDEFVEKFSPLMEMLWEKYEGDIDAFGKDSKVENFNYYDQTLRHEEMHVNARNLAVIDLLPQFKRFLKDSGGLEKGEAYFLDRVDFFWAAGWDDETEKKISHERIHELDARNMVEEYQRRAGTEKPKPEPSIIESVWDFFGF
jgi:hypothetical protein